MQSQTSTPPNRNINHFNDGVDTSETLRNAYNAAFIELALGWHWGVSQFRERRHHADERSRKQVYLSAQQPHLLKLYDVDSFVDAVREAKTHYYRTLEVTNNLGERLSTA